MTEQVTPAETPGVNETISKTIQAASTPAPKSDANELPDWARQQISSANAEAASRRVELKAANDARTQLEEQVATLTAEKTEAVNSHTSLQSDFDKLATAVKALVPAPEKLFTFAVTLQGDNEEALSAHANSLIKTFGINSGPSPAVDRSQGQGSGAPANDLGSQFEALMNSQLHR